MEFGGINPADATANLKDRADTMLTAPHARKNNNQEATGVHFAGRGGSAVEVFRGPDRKNYTFYTADKSGEKGKFLLSDNGERTTLLAQEDDGNLTIADTKAAGD